MIETTRPHPIYLAALVERERTGREPYIDTADVAKLIRGELGRRWPNVRFYVRLERYAGGSSINVAYDGLDHWARIKACHCADGPTVHDYAPNQCQACGYMARLEAVMKAGAPVQQDVRDALGGYAGQRFDGMIDMAYGVSSWLNRDGSVTVGANPGTGGQRGSDPGYIASRTDAAALLVHIGASYVFVEHELPYSVTSKRA